MCFREKLVKAELSEHVNLIYVFHDGNSTLYMVTSIYHKAGFLLKVILTTNVIHSINLININKL